LLGWVDDPRSIAIVGDVEILTIAVNSDGTSDSLNTCVSGNDANGLFIWIDDLRDVSRIVKFVEFAASRTSRQARTSWDSTTWDLHKERWIGWLTDSNYSPLNTL
jgi:hypothetical protein